MTKPKAEAPPRPRTDARQDGEDDRRAPPATRRPREIGGPKGPEPTRYGDWEKGGRCTDF